MYVFIDYNCCDRIFKVLFWYIFIFTLTFIYYSIKMKKILLSSLLGLFGLVGFSNAVDYTFGAVDPTSSYNPNSFTVSSDSVIESVSTTEFGTYGAICVCKSNSSCGYDWESIGGIDTNSDTLCFFETDSNSDTCTNKNIPAWTYYVNNCEDMSFNTVVLSIPGGSSGGWDINEDDSDSLLIWWVSALNPIISSLQNTFLEFIPYIVYIWLWILGAVIWFFAIRWLVNWVRAKVYWTFSSWRRR